MRMTLARTALMVIFSVSPAAAMTGNELHGYCEHDGPKPGDVGPKGLLCIGYISGVVDGYDVGRKLSDGKPTICIEKGSPRERFIIPVKAYLAARPDLRHYPAVMLIVAALEAK